MELEFELEAELESVLKRARQENGLPLKKIAEIIIKTMGEDSIILANNLILKK